MGGHKGIGMKFVMLSHPLVIKINHLESDIQLMGIKQNNICVRHDVQYL